MCNIRYKFVALIILIILLASAVSALFIGANCERMGGTFNYETGECDLSSLAAEPGTPIFLYVFGLFVLWYFIIFQGGKKK